MTDSALQALLDERDVIRVTTEMGWYADTRRWEALDSVLDEQVELDYTSLQGGRPAVLPRNEVVTAWRSVLGGFTGTCHLVAGHRVDVEEDDARCTATFLATHHLAAGHGDPLWVLGGRYTWRLRRSAGGWRITAVTMTAVHSSGNQKLAELAADIAGRATAR